MKKLLAVMTVIILTIVLGGCSTSEPRIGVLNMERVLQESERARELKKQLEEVGNKLESDYDQGEEEPAGEESDEELDRLYMEFLDNKQRLEGQLNRELEGVLKELAEEKNLEIVLYDKYVEYGGLEITEEVIIKLDEGQGGGDEEDNETR